MGVDLSSFLKASNGKRYQYIGHGRKVRFAEEDERQYRRMQKELDDFHAGKASRPNHEQDPAVYLCFLVWQEHQANQLDYEASLENPDAYPHIWRES